MLRSYDFYKEKLGISEYDILRISTIINSFNNGEVCEEDIRSLKGDGLKFCLCEGMFDTFKKLVSPFEYDDNGTTRYKYLLDSISLGLVEFINSCPSSIMEEWAKDTSKSVEEAAMEAVVLYPNLKKDLLDAIYSIEEDKIMTIKIKDVLARQISGVGKPIKGERDVVYYAELPLLLPCLDLFKKNIITVANDTGGCYDDHEINEDSFANIIIDYNSLDEGNKEIAQMLVADGHGKILDVLSGKELFIEVPCKRNETVLDVSKRMMDLVNLFHKQDMLYGKMNDEDIDNFLNFIYRYLSDDKKKKVFNILSSGYTDQNILQAISYSPYSFMIYYDTEEKKFWKDKYYYDKHKKYLDEQNKDLK